MNSGVNSTTGCILLYLDVGIFIILAILNTSYKISHIDNLILKRLNCLLSSIPRFSTVCPYKAYIVSLLRTFPGHSSFLGYCTFFWHKMDGDTYSLRGTDERFLTLIQNLSVCLDAIRYQRLDQGREEKKGRGEDKWGNREKWNWEPGKKEWRGGP